MKITERDLPFAIRAANAHHRVERGKRDTHVAGMSGDALIALAENGMNAVVAVDRSAAAPGFPFVTRRKRGIVKVIATRSLHQIPAHGCHVEKLRTRSSKECLALKRV